jgi:hypothetical protein
MILFYNGVMATNQKAVLKAYAGIWLTIALITIGWLVYKDIEFNSCCRGKTSDMGIGITQFFLGAPSFVVGFSAIVVLLTKNRTLMLLALLILGLVTTLFFLSLPIVSLTCLMAAAYAIYCAHKAYPAHH